MQRLELFKADPLSIAFIALVFLCGITYTALRLTPSSYGVVLEAIGAPEEGPTFGIARPLRSDEWAGTTALVQACVRNGFTRINTSSFYQEDLRNFYLLPIKDWSLAFKPELWGFFVLPPATAFSLYYASLLCAFLIGYFLLFRLIGLDVLVAAAGSLLLYFCGFTQFWWTSFASLTGGLPWILLIMLAELRWWLKTILLCCVVPVVAFSFVYPSFFIEFAFAAIVLIAMLEPSWFRRPLEIAAIAIAGVFTGALLYLYYQDIIPIMSNTWYPARRMGNPGTVPVTAALSQIFPFLSFSLRDYRHLVGDNICEIANVGSFLPLLTVCCLTRFTARLRRAFIVLGGGLALITLWQVAPAPRWIGHLLLWDHAAAGRLLFISGFLLTLGCLFAWREQALAASPLRIAVFLLIGPIAAVVLKMHLFRLELSSCTYDIALSALVIAAGVVAGLGPAAMRLPVLLTAIIVVNIGGFARYNPLQSADPIFNVPETDLVHRLQEKQDSTPGHYLLTEKIFGGSLNGMGFRSVSHVLQAPQTAFFRQFFPQMDPTRFDFIFNRYSSLVVTDDRFPQCPENFVIILPREAFEPVLNVRRAVVDTPARKDCALRRGGAIEKVTEQPDGLMIEGWSPWKSEDSNQELHISAAAPVRVVRLSTVKRPDVAESRLDYGYARSGFKLELMSSTGHKLQSKDLVLTAHGTANGKVLLPGCGCP